MFRPAIPVYRFIGDREGSLIPTAKHLVLFIDRLPARWLPTYGCDWLETPELDRFASEAVVFDAVYATLFDTGMDEYLEAGLAKPGFEAEQAGLVLSELDDAVESGDGEAAEAVAGVLAGIERLLGGEGPAIYWLDLHADLEPVEGNEPESEAIKRTMLRLDSLLGILRGMLAETGLADGVRIWLLAGRGWPLPGASAEELSQSNVQVPALLFIPGGSTGERRRQLVSLDDLLDGLFEDGERLGAVLASDTAPGRESLAIQDGGCVSLRTVHWTYRFEGKHLLFRKPEDRFEVDDIASKYGDWCERAKEFALAGGSELPADLHQPTNE